MGTPQTKFLNVVGTAAVYKVHFCCQSHTCPLFAIQKQIYLKEFVSMLFSVPCSLVKNNTHTHTHTHVYTHKNTHNLFLFTYIYIHINFMVIATLVTTETRLHDIFLQVRDD